MASFQKLKTDGKLKDIIKSAFDTTLSVDGGWGYDKESSTLIELSDQPIEQLEHLIASMRTYIEMNMTLGKEDRYGGINLNEIEREEHHDGTKHYHVVKYSISAMKELIYNEFVNEYKENYGKESFDLSEYFERRRGATLKRTETYWFEIKTGQGGH